jgi:hypothetical protein
VGSPAVGGATESVGVGSVIAVVCPMGPGEAVGGRGGGDEDSGCAEVVVGKTTCGVVVAVWVFVRLGLGVMLLEVMGRRGVA